MVDMTREDAKKWIKNLISEMKKETSGNFHDPEYRDEVYEALDMVVQVLEQEPCEDAISRQAAINSIWNGTNMDVYTREVKESLEELPPVTPQPKTGHWIMKNPSPYEPWRCSNCNSVGSNLYNFCPNCGAKMVEIQESEDKE